MIKAYVLYGQGIGCHKEAAHAYEKAGVDAEIIHVRQMLTGEKDIFKVQIINFPGGFWHGDILGSAMPAANELEHSKVKSNDIERKVKDLLLEFVEKGNILYGQCNGFQFLVKTGLLPGLEGDYTKQTVTLTYNDCGNYFVAPTLHVTDQKHFAFDGIEDDLYLMCRHGEGKIQFYSDYGLVSKEKGEIHRNKTNKSHVILRYADPTTKEPTQKFPYNPNGSVDAIAGLINENGRIIGHMAHTEVAVYLTHDPRWPFIKDMWRRQGIKAKDIDEKKLEHVGLKIFRNIVNYFK